MDGVRVNPLVLKALKKLQTVNVKDNAIRPEAFMLLGYKDEKSNEVVLVEEGESTLYALFDKIPADEPRYILWRTDLKLGVAHSAKFIFISYLPKTLKAFRKAALGSHSAKIKEILAPIHIFWQASDMADLRSEEILQKLGISVGTRVSVFMTADVPPSLMLGPPGKSPPPRWGAPSPVSPSHAAQPRSVNTIAPKPISLPSSGASSPPVVRTGNISARINAFSSPSNNSTSSATKSSLSSTGSAASSSSTATSSNGTASKWASTFSTNNSSASSAVKSPSAASATSPTTSSGDRPRHHKTPTPAWKKMEKMRGNLAYAPVVDGASGGGSTSPYSNRDRNPSTSSTSSTSSTTTASSTSSANARKEKEAQEKAAADKERAEKEKEQREKEQREKEQREQHDKEEREKRDREEREKQRKIQEAEAEALMAAATARLKRQEEERARKEKEKAEKEKEKADKDRQDHEKQEKEKAEKARLEAEKQQQEKEAEERRRRESDAKKKEAAVTQKRRESDRSTNVTNAMAINTAAAPAPDTASPPDSPVGAPQLPTVRQASPSVSRVNRPTTVRESVLIRNSCAACVCKGVFLFGAEEELTGRKLCRKCKHSVIEHSITSQANFRRDEEERKIKASGFADGPRESWASLDNLILYWWKIKEDNPSTSPVEDGPLEEQLMAGEVVQLASWMLNVTDRHYAFRFLTEDGKVRMLYMDDRQPPILWWYNIMEWDSTRAPTSPSSSSDAIARLEAEQEAAALAAQGGGGGDSSGPSFVTQVQNPDEYQARQTESQSNNGYGLYVHDDEESVSDSLRDTKSL